MNADRGMLLLGEQLLLARTSEQLTGRCSQPGSDARLKSLVRRTLHGVTPLADRRSHFQRFGGNRRAALMLALAAGSPL